MLCFTLVKNNHFFLYFILLCSVAHFLSYIGEPLVVTAPTGSGKTVIFELAIIHLLMSLENQAVRGDFKIVYSK